MYSCDDVDAHAYIMGMYNDRWRIVTKKETDSTYYQITGIVEGGEDNIIVWRESVDIPMGYPDCFFDKYPDNELEDNIRKLSTHQEGYVYILSNPYMPHIFKIGKTKQTPEVRAKRLSQEAGVIGMFNVEYQLLVNDCDLVEVVVHHILRENRINIDREFFAIDLEDAKQVIWENRDKTVEDFKSHEDK